MVIRRSALRTKLLWSSLTFLGSLGSLASADPLPRQEAFDHTVLLNAWQDLTQSLMQNDRQNDRQKLTQKRKQKLQAYPTQAMQADIRRMLAPYATGRLLRAAEGFREPMYIIDTPDTPALRNLRSSVTDAVAVARAGGDTRGLAELNLFLHAQFSRQGLGFIHRQMDELVASVPGTPPPQRFFIDLREEPVVFVTLTDGLEFPLSYFSPRNRFNHGKSRATIQREDAARLAQLNTAAYVLAYLRLGKDAEGAATELLEFRLPLRRVQSEAAVVQASGGHYLKFAVSDHEAPTPAVVDEFVAFYRQAILGRSPLLSIHCKAGRGRTSTFGVLVDMLANHYRHAPSEAVALEAILTRHHLLGGIDFYHQGDGYRRVLAEERRLLLEAFYRYLASGALEAEQSFRVWLAGQAGA